MREILFRGQTRRKGEKVYMGTGKPVDGNLVYGGITQGTGDFSVMYSYDPVEKHVVYTDTVGQFTGLTDKNGKKIFEGDIVKCLHTHRLLEEKEKVLARKNPRRSYGLELVKREDPIYRLYSGDKDLYDLTYFRNYVVKADIVRQKTRLQNGSDTHYLSASYVSNHEIEVIGNIHDNPELLNEV